jgi:capsular exopolysaccharide synthesis family protein
MQDQRLATILWRGKWIILATVVVGIALAYVATHLSAKVYEASATIQVNAGGVAGSNAATPNDIVNANLGLAQTYATLVTDRSFLQQIQPRVFGGRLSVGALESRLSAKAVQNTSLVQLSAQGPSPSDARALVGAVARNFVVTIGNDSTQRTDRLQEQIQLRIQQLDREISRGGGKQTLDSLRGARAELEKQLAALVAGQIAQGASVTMVGQPTGSSAPVKPRPLLNMIAGVLLGLLAGIGLSYLRVRLDRALHSAAEAEQLLGVPVLAPIPIRRRVSADDPLLGEAFDVLRANLAFLSHDQALQALTFSSYNPREGKSSTVEGVAYAAVRGGLSVLLIDGDVRTRSLSGRLRHADAPGLTNVIVGMASVDDTIVELTPGLSLLPAGPMPPNPPSLLSSVRMREVLAELRERYGLILIDSPPVAHLADASILASVSDGVIVVARVGVTNRSDLPAAAANLRQVPTPIVGVVVLEPRTIDETYYPAVSKGTQPAVPTESAAADPVESL